MRVPRSQERIATCTADCVDRGIYQMYEGELKDSEQKEMPVMVDRDKFGCRFSNTSYFVIQSCGTLTRTSSYSLFQFSDLQGDNVSRKGEEGIFVVVFLMTKVTQRHRSRYR